MSKRIVGVLALLLIGSAVMVWAVQYPLDVTELTIEGNDRIKTHEILAAVPFGVGDSITATEVRDASQAIFDLGWFSEVAVDPDALDEGRLIFSVVENPVIKRIEVTGNDTPRDYKLFGVTIYRAPIMTDYKIRQILWRADVRRRSVLNQESLSDGANDIKKEYADRGYPMISIASANVVEGVLTIEIVEHPYAGSNIDGLSSIPTSVAEEMIDIPVGSPLRVRDFAMAYNALSQSVYFRDVNYATEAGFNGVDLWIRWTLTERVLLTEPADVQAIEFVGNTAYSSETLESQMGDLPVGSLDNYALLQVLEPVYDYYIKHGYSVTDFGVVSDVDGVLTIDVKEGTISEITISGNTTTKDYVIERNIELAVGDTYNAGPAAVSYQQLMALGYFRSVNIMPEWTDDGVSVAIMITEKGSLGGFNGSMAIDPSTGHLVGELSLKEKNLFGTGQDLELSYSRGITATDEDSPSTWNLGYSTVAFIPGFDRVGLDLYQETQDVKKDEGTTVRTVLGTGISFAYPVADYSNLGLAFRHEREHLTGETHWTPTDVIEVTLSYNDTDDPYFPTLGDRRQLGLEKAGGFSAGTEYTKVDFTWVHFSPSSLTLFSHDMDQVLATRIKVGWSDAGLPESKLYKLGGATTVRGFESLPVGRMVFSNSEYRIELTEGLQLATFFDLGLDLDHVRPDELLASTGIEFSINAAGVFVRLDLIWKLGEDASWLPVFDFGFGPMF